MPSYCFFCQAATTASRLLSQLQVFAVRSCTMHVYHLNVHNLQMQRHKSFDQSIHKINFDKNIKNWSGTGLDLKHI